MCKEYSSDIFKPEMLAKAVQRQLQVKIQKLEGCVPQPSQQPFFFLALDECGSMPTLLPVIHHVWFHAKPTSCWILLVDTNSDLALLTGDVAHKEVLPY